MKVLITGADGFIGNALIRELIKDSAYTVYGLARSPSPASINASNYFHIQADISSPDFINKLPDEVSCVIHTAQSRRYREFPEHGEDIFQVNTRSTFDLLNWARKAKVTKFFYTSTGNVYAPSSSLLKEEDPSFPGSFYAATKLASENLIVPYSAFFETYILRIFGAYGPGQKAMIIPNMIASVKEGKEITLAKNQGLIMTPLFIDDLVKLLEILIGKESVGKGNFVFNMAGKEKISLQDIVSQTAFHLTREAKIVITQNEPAYLTGSNEKIVRYTHYNEFTEFKKGLSLVLKDYE